MKYDKGQRTKSSLEVELKSISDPRSTRGTRYSLPFLLNCTTCAIMNGATGFSQIAHWVKAQPKAKLKKMGNKRKSRPVESTIRKTLSRIDMDEFRDKIYSWTVGSTPFTSLAVDGKVLKGSRDEDGKQLHFLSMTTHGEAITIGDRQVANKESEISEIRPLLDTIDIEGKIITADALHSTKDFGQYLKSRGADYVYLVKGNRKNLIKRLDRMDILHSHDSEYMSVNDAHGRLEIRQIYTTSDLPFSLNYASAAQAFLIKRTTFIKKTGIVRNESVYGLTSLSRENADAEEILKINREHWSIENKVFHVRDVTFNEDRSRIRTKSAPALMLALRNITMNLFRKLKKTNMAEAIRDCIYGRDLDLRILATKF